MAEKKEHDGVRELRTGFGTMAEKVEFSSAMGGYNRIEVNRYIEEQNEAAEKLKRVFYDKTQELRDEMALLSEENRALRAAAESFVPSVALTEPYGAKSKYEHDDARKLVEQVAAILKGKQAAELRRADDESTARIAELNSALASREAELAAVKEKLASAEAVAASLSEALDKLQSTSGASQEELAKKDDDIAMLADKLALREVEMRRGELQIAKLNAGLLEKEGELVKLREAINEIAKLNKGVNDEETDGAKHDAHKEKEHGKIIVPRFINSNIG